MKIEAFVTRLAFSLCFGGVLHLVLMNSLLGAIIDSNPAEAGLQWSLSSYRLPDKMYGHTLVAAEKHLFVFGGWVEQNSSSGISEDVLCAQTAPNGDTLEWRRIDKGLKQPVYVHATVVANDKVYIIGGTTANKLQTSKVYFANVPNSCFVDQIPWQETNDTLPKALERHAAVYYDGVIYVVGGRNEQDGTLNTTYSAIIRADGQIDNWREDLPKLKDFSIQNHSLIVYNNRLYLIGGRTGSGQEVKSIYFADILARGVISDWKPLPSEQFLPHTLYSHRALVSDNGRVFVLGGFYSGSVKELLSANILENGFLTSWEYEQPLPSNLHWHASIIADNGVIYVVGGITSTNNGYTWSHEYSDRTFYTGAPVALTKSSDPSGPVHEGNIITYTLSYANTSLTTQTMIITDILPFNVSLIGNPVPPAVPHGSTLVWDLGEVPSGQSGQISFQVQVPLLPSLSQTVLNPLCDPTPTPPSLPAYVLPVNITCDTTRFWATGVTAQPVPSSPYTLHVQIPPGTAPSTMWLLMKGTDNDPPTIEGVPAQLITTSNNNFGASLWAAEISAEMIATGWGTVVTQQPRDLNAVFLFNRDDPPFVETELDDFYRTTKVFTYTLDIPSVTTQPIDVIIPFMDVTYLTDNLLPDSRLTTVTAQFAGQSRTIIANDPNVGNGLLMTQFPFEIGHLNTTTAVRVLTITVDTEDSIYTLGPRVCRPVYIENTAWLCSQQAGCVSSVVRNVPGNFSYPYSLYLPAVLKSIP